MHSGFGADGLDVAGWGVEGLEDLLEVKTIARPA